MSSITLTAGRAVTLLAGIVVLVGSFAPFWRVDDEGRVAARAACAAIAESTGTTSPSIGATDPTTSSDDDLAARCDAISSPTVWDRDLLFPVAAWAVVLGVAVALVLGLDSFTNVNLPEVAGFAPAQLLAGLAAPGALISLAFLAEGPGTGLEWGSGFWLVLLGSLAILGGTVAEVRRPRAIGDARWARRRALAERRRPTT